MPSINMGGDCDASTQLTQDIYLFVPLHISQNGHHKQINKQQVLRRLWRKGNPCALLVGMQTGAATVENSMEFPKKN